MGFLYFMRSMADLIDAQSESVRETAHAQGYEAACQDGEARYAEGFNNGYACGYGEGLSVATSGPQPTAYVSFQDCNNVNVQVVPECTTEQPLPDVIYLPDLSNETPEGDCNCEACQELRRAMFALG